MSMLNNEQWGNIELPGLADDKLLNTNWNHVTGIRQRNADPKYQQAIDRRTQDPNWREANHQSVLKTVQTEQWQTNHAAGMKRMKNDPKWQQEQRDRFERRSKNEVWRQRKTEASRKLAKDPKWLTNTTIALRDRCCKPIVTPVGAYPSLTEAGLVYNEIRNFRNGRKWIINQMKVNPKEFYYISREEYIILTGEDIV